MTTRQRPAIALPLARTLALRLVVVAIFVLIVQALYVVWEYSRGEDYLATTAVEEELASLTAATQFGGIERIIAGVEKLPDALKTRYRDFPKHYGFELIGADGAVLAGTNRGVLRAIPVETGSLAEEVDREDTIDGGSRHYGSQTLVIDGAVYRLRVAIIDDPARIRDQILLHEVIDHVTLPGIPLVLLMLATIWLLLRKALRPLETAAASVEHVASAHDNVRLDLAGAPAEVVALGRAVNQLLDRLHAALAAQRDFAADVAHELRTPLALLTLELGSIDHPAARRAKADAVAMSSLVAQLLAMAQLEGLDPSRLVRIDLSLLARDVVGQLAPLAIRAGKEIEFVDHAAGIILGQRQTIEGALRNLLDNALRLTAPGGVIRVEAGNGAVLRVIDQGPGVPIEALESIFRRFHQGSGGSSGSAGLGLAIVRRTMELHGGAATAANLPQGGACFSLDFRQGSLDRA